MAERSTTERGFVIYDEFTDVYGDDVRIQESSSATGARVWIFCKSKPAFPQEGTSPHLNVEQAKRVRDALNVFISEHSDEAG
jgi:hypothetical protein